MILSRRHFMKNASAAALAFGGLRQSGAQAQVYAVDPQRGMDRFGQLHRDPAGILNLPAGFSYNIISRTGDPMSDGLITPSAPDGMAAFPVANQPGKSLLVRNHELDSLGEEVDAFGGSEALARKHVGKKAYDYFHRKLPVNGGTTTLLYDHVSGRVERSHLSLIGTARNCAGGPTPWNSWLTCEETLVTAAQGFGREHGYLFEVPAAHKGLVDPVPLKDMGRFLHEAAAVDSTTGVVYLTEDFARGLFYRFLPRQPGELAKGGTLQALIIRGWASADTRNHTATEIKSDRMLMPLDKKFECEWLDLDAVTAPDGDLSERGALAGAAIFSRCEGVAFALRSDGQREIFFAATGGGPEQLGQIWRYQPSLYEGTVREKEAPGTLELIYESRHRAHLEACDNLTVAPWGDLIICEDSYSADPTMVNYMRGLTPEGKIYTLAMNAHPDKGEFCGACFSADGTILFVNIQRPGMTLAITGPWGSLRNTANL